MRKSIFAAAVIASMFPYTQVIPLGSYTQPYALLLSILASIYSFPIILKNSTLLDNVTFISLLFIGVIVFMITCFPYSNEQDLKSLLTYISPLFFYATAFSFFRVDANLFRRVVSWSAIIWLIVGFIQAFFDPSFASGLVGKWSEASEIVVESGRGVVALAPEPTHHGFHMLLLASIIYILRGQLWLIIACILSAIFLARSSSSILAILISAVLLFTLNPIRLFRYLLAFALLLGISFVIMINYVGESDIRAVRLTSVLLTSPEFLIQADYSVNARLGGLIAGVDIIIKNFFMPFGLSNSDWISHIPYVLQQYPWLFGISSAGIPSGIFIVVYQIGFFGLVFFLYLTHRLMSIAHSPFAKYLFLTAIIVFTGQYLISNPLFGLLVGCAIASTRAKIGTGTMSKKYGFSSFKLSN